MQPIAGRTRRRTARWSKNEIQDFPIQGYAVTAKWAKQNPNTLKAFTIALSQGQQVADTDRAAVENVLANT